MSTYTKAMHSSKIQHTERLSDLADNIGALLLLTGIVICSAIALWLLASFIDINLHNTSAVNTAKASWNFFCLIAGR